MLSANVLCLKKKKRRTYSLSNAGKGFTGSHNDSSHGGGNWKDERSRAGTMIQITEDTPPDMLAGAMDLTVHLPNGKSVKMSVERSTPMMDLLVQITVANHLQLSKYTLQALGRAPSSQHNDIVLPFKPNTPIGALDIQHVKVLAKEKSLHPPKYLAPGYQPFESTFRLKVHLPKNQLYVTRVSRNVLLEDIMRKVCDEKNLDSKKYEFKHPANPDEVLEPKLTLSDYQITEIYVVAKGTTNLSQTFSTTDIMTLRKEEERKQMHNKTGSGVFNLIFKRGSKSNMGSGSVSSENRSISPIHSDDSRSVTPPAIQSVVQKNPPPERPRPPQRKRRPAPKPPQQQSLQSETDNIQNENSSTIPSVNNKTTKSNDNNNGLTICHSRNSSDSSGYHEASILSDHASLPRNARPRSAVISTTTTTTTATSQMSSNSSVQNTTNLTKMSTHSRSATSLIMGRRKKAAPPPPPPLRSSSPVNLEPASSDIPSPNLIASHSDITICKDSKINGINSPSSSTSSSNTNTTPPVPMPRTKHLHVKETPAEENEIEDLAHRTPSILSSSRSSFNDCSIEEMLASLEAINKFHNTRAELPLPAAPPQKPEIIEMIQKPRLSQLNRSNLLMDDDGLLDVSGDDSMFDVISMADDPLDGENNGQCPSIIDKQDNEDQEIDFIDAKNPNILYNNQTTESKLTSDQTFLVDNYIPSPVESSTPIKNQEKISDSTDSGIAQDVVERDDYIVAADTPSPTPTPPPPPPLFDNNDDIVVQDSTLPATSPLIEIEWQYQLPSPPKAFRDVSPNRTPSSEVTSNSVTSDFKDSVVTSPELFEKLKTLEDNQSDKDTLKSETTSSSTISEEPLNTLSLEHLEKRQSLVYNRELSTSLKMTDNNLGNKHRNVMDTFKNSLTDFKTTYNELHHSNAPSQQQQQQQQQQKQPQKPVRINLPLQHNNNTLPNFKITTYDVPKQNITVFEDDTIRSNLTATLKRKEFGRSMENISFSRKIRDDDDDIEENNKIKPSETEQIKTNVARSGSFSTDRIPNKPVSRSKSTLTLNKYQHGSSINNRGEESMSRSNSLFDVSGLQSLEVIKLIQNKLNTPTTSVENVDIESTKTIDEKILTNGKDVKPLPEPTSPPSTRKYYYRGPPAVNMTTWSERPKIPVAVKEDADYKLGNANHTSSSKIIVKTIKTTVSDISDRKEKLSTEKANEENYGNVLIKIRDNRNNIYTKNTENQQQQRFIGATAYRKPFTHIKPQSQRPHSVAFGSDFDVSRVPVVRSVEFKKPFKDNTSITHIYQTSPEEIETNNKNINNKFASMFRSTENLRQDPEPTKRMFRINTQFKTGEPIVRGFQSTTTESNINKRSSWMEPFNYGTLPNTKSTVNHNKEFATNQNVPFSQMTLRRTESSKLIKPTPTNDRITEHTSSSYTSLPPSVHLKNRTDVTAPPPPPPPKFATLKSTSRESSKLTTSPDARGMLLESIRNFGGAKGLRVVKAS